MILDGRTSHLKWMILYGKIVADLILPMTMQNLTRLNLEWNNWLGDQDLGFLPQLTSLHTLSIANCMLLGAKVCIPTHASHIVHCLRSTTPS